MLVNFTSTRAVHLCASQGVLTQLVSFRKRPARVSRASPRDTNLHAFSKPRTNILSSSPSGTPIRLGTGSAQGRAYTQGLGQRSSRTHASDASDVPNCSRHTNMLPPRPTDVVGPANPNNVPIREKFMSQVHTWGDASLLALLLAADFSWLIADADANQIALPMALIWSLFITVCAFVERRTNPDEFVVAATTALWCFGNGFWTLSDFAEWREMERETAGRSGYDGYVGVSSDTFTYAGIEFHDVRLLDMMAFVCFFIAFLVGVWYYTYARFSVEFIDARNGRGDGLVEAEDIVMDVTTAAGSQSVPSDDERRALVGASANSSSSSAVLDTTAHRTSNLASDKFLGPMFMPNVLSIQSRAEYESLSHFLWITKDLVWWCAVENDEYVAEGLLSFAKFITVVVAILLITHSVDALLVANRDVNDSETEYAVGDVEGDIGGNIRVDNVQTPPTQNANYSEVATRFALIFWVLAMAIWSFGDMFFPDPDLRIGVKVELFSLNDDSDVEGPESSRWWAAWFMSVGVAVLVAFWGTEAVRAVKRSRTEE